ncbi:hypothetical protein ABSDF_p20021 (plasmid) [Acinetobacter baumannii SDF]|uniref:Uncharacterized protein n=1 Tax=Acinetobacter baumannii (strain SDF) TaxID=509170 RepID=B0VVD3_ACIBS|nr:hypothetical protein ABSDF_p20021 [Acinetobacter baumannii SDF]
MSNIYKNQTDKNEPLTTVILNEYVVVVGFEVNHPNAFVIQDNGWFTKSNERTQLLDIDYGHAFFYVTKNDVVEVFFSFGPYGAGKDGWFNKGNSRSPNGWNTGAVVKNGYASSRPGTPDYPITEKATLYRMLVSEKMAKKIIDETNTIRSEIISGDQKYTAWVNDTCAETAYDILVNYISNLPMGTGAVKQSGAPVLKVINPYMWHYNFTKSKFAKPEIIYPTVGKTSGKAVLSSNGINLNNSWTLKPKDIDPIVTEGYIIRK